MRIRVATLNVWGLPEPLAPSVPARMQAIGRQMASLDLDAIAFQEVWTEDARSELVAAGRAAGLPLAWHHPAGFGGGLLVLTRLPIRSARFVRSAARRSGAAGSPDTKAARAGRRSSSRPAPGR
jgi:hypothetical protein